eukprot:gene2692-2942_t
MRKAAVYRNIFAYEDEDPAWKTVLSQFPNHVPRFEDKASATAFTQSHCLTHSNPDYPQLQHSVTTLIDWKQIETVLLPRIREYERRWPSSSSSMESMDSVEKGAGQLDEMAESVHNYARSRLNLKIHREMSEASRMNTLRYLFFHMKCGIYVMIRNNSLAIFAPFVNKDYTNSWRGELRIGSMDGTVQSYVEEKAEYYRGIKMHYLDMSAWWANGNIICNDYGGEEAAESNQFWGDHFLLQLKDMFAELCRTRKVPDCEFFINKRDYPQLKYNGSTERAVEPYGFIFNRDDRREDEDLPLRRYCYSSYAPIMSFYSSERFADIPIPPTEDWEAATGCVYPASFKYSRGADGQPEVAAPRDLFTHSNLARFDTPWEKKVNTAFFRGTATGGGVSTETNQRLHIAQVSYDWSLLPDLNGSKPNTVPYLDAKITGWNLRDKKISSTPMTFVHSRSFPFEGDRKKNFVEIYKQSTYKYLLYVEGHCAACRYGFMMQLGSVILKVESACVADSMWYFPLLKPYVDHVPVKADLSDLQQVLEWCHSHDVECRQIAERAREIYRRYISREGIMDYLQTVCREIAQRWRYLPAWCAEAPEESPPPAVPRYEEIVGRMHDCTGNRQLCSYCEEMAEKEKANALNKQSNTIKKNGADSANDALRKARNAQLKDRRKGIRVQETPSAALPQQNQKQESELGKRSRDDEPEEVEEIVDTDYRDD